MRLAGETNPYSRRRNRRMVGSKGLSTRRAVDVDLYSKQGCEPRVADRD